MLCIQIVYNTIVEVDHVRSLRKEVRHLGSGAARDLAELVKANVDPLKSSAIAHKAGFIQAIDLVLDRLERTHPE